MADPSSQRHIAPVLPRNAESQALHPLGLDSVTITSGHWADWQAANRSVTTPHEFHWLERDGSIDNLRRLAPEAAGEPARRGLWFTDSDVYKAVEGVAWDLARGDDPDQSQLLHQLSTIIGEALEEDGYINSFVQAGLDVKWDNLAKSHELYCMGHLIQAGIAAARATGSTDLLATSVRVADCIVDTFGDGRRLENDGHEEIEMALVELYRETGDRRYLDMARQFVDTRGTGTLPGNMEFDADYYQDGTPVREQTTTIGHAVRAGT